MIIQMQYKSDMAKTESINSEEQMASEHLWASINGSKSSLYSLIAHQSTGHTIDFRDP